ncbi:MAG: ARPP-1 family domain-containing protein [Gaiellaceae bacterium]
MPASAGAEAVGQGRYPVTSHTAYPELRRRKAERLAAAPLRPGVAQDEVWSAVAEKSIRLGAFSPTGAQAHIFALRGRELADLRGRFALEPGQAGALVALGSDLLCLDYVSRPEAVARLYPKLLDGYLLDALERLDTEQTAAERLEAFVEAVLAAPRRREPSVGLGEDVRMSAKGLVGSGLELDGELLQLSAYSTT